MPTQEFWPIVAEIAGLVFIYMTAWFVVATAIKRNDLADVAWGIGFIVITAWLLIRTDAPSLRQYVMSVLVLVWGGRLAWHVARRNLRPGATEDRRYAKWREEWGKWLLFRSFLQVFMLQGLFMLLISSPLLVAASGDAAFGVLGVLGVVVWVAGFLFESVGDAQLAAFLANPANRGTIMTGGLWAYTRHPNYFGEAIMWWGLAIAALAVPGGWVAFVGPITITWLLVKVSGIPLAERSMGDKPGWAEYKVRTSAFVPLPPKKR